MTLRKVNVEGSVDVEHQNAITRIAAGSTNLSALIAATLEKEASDAAAAATPSPSSLNVTVIRDRNSDLSDESGRRVWGFHIRIANTSSQEYPKVAVRFFAFVRAANNDLALAANEVQSADVPANGEITIDPAKLRLDKTRSFDGYAVLVRDAKNAIIGSTSTRDSVVRNWEALEALPPGSPVP